MKRKRGCRHCGKSLVLIYNPRYHFSRSFAEEDGKMAGLVCYDSADSENEEISQSKCERNEVPGSGSSVSAGAGDLEAEWESFEKLISGATDEPGPAGGSSILVEPSGVPCPSLATLSSSSPPLVSHAKVAGADSYETSLRLQQNAYSCSYEPESLFERRTSVSSAHDSDSDMDVCSNSSSNQKRSPPSRRPTTSSISSSAILAANDAANCSDLDESGSESSKSARSSVKETSRKRFSEFKGSDEDKHEEKRVRRGSSSSESASHSDDDDDDDNAIHPAMLHEDSHSSDSDKSAASPKLASSSSPPDLSPKKVIASDASETATAKKTAEPPKEASQDRLRSKLLALAEEKVRTSRSKSRDRSSKRHGHHSPSPSRRRVGDHRSTDRHKKRRSSRSLSRERRRRTSRDGHGRRHHSRSRSPRRRSHRSRSRSHSRRHYRDRRDRRPQSHRSRSHDRGAGDKRRKSGGGSPPRPKMNFKEQLKAQLMQVQKQTVDDITQDIVAVIEHKPLVTANEKKSTLPLNNPNPLTAMVTGAKDKVTPQQALMQTMAAMHAKAQELTGVAVPSYYNPAAVNPLKYAEQLKKRKLLWSKNKETEKEKECQVESKAQWTSTSFAADQDGKMAAKFRKLMGIKEEDKMLLLDNVDLSKLTEEQRQRQEELFMQLDREYAFARMTTHTHRGIGLGFQSQGLPDV